MVNINNCANGICFQLPASLRGIYYDFPRGHAVLIGVPQAPSLPHSRRRRQGSLDTSIWTVSLRLLGFVFWFFFLVFPQQYGKCGTK